MGAWPNNNGFLLRFGNEQSGWCGSINGSTKRKWAAITSIASKIGCAAETLRLWVRRAERDAGQRPGLTTDEAQRLKLLERENRELRRANEINHGALHGRAADAC